MVTISLIFGVMFILIVDCYDSVVVVACCVLLRDCCVLRAACCVLRAACLSACCCVALL